MRTILIAVGILIAGWGLGGYLLDRNPTRLVLAGILGMAWLVLVAIYHRYLRKSI